MAEGLDQEIDRPVFCVGCSLPVSPWVENKAAIAWSQTGTQLDVCSPTCWHLDLRSTTAAGSILAPAPPMLLLLLVRGATSQGCQCPMPIVVLLLLLLLLWSSSMRNTDRNTLDEPFLCPAVGGLGENWIVARLQCPVMAQHCKTKLCIVAFNVLINGQVKKYGTMQPLPFINKQNITGHTNQIPFLKLWFIFWTRQCWLWKWKRLWEPLLADPFHHYRRSSDPLPLIRFCRLQQQLSFCSIHAASQNLQPSPIIAWYLYGTYVFVWYLYGVCMILHWIVSLLPIAGLQQKLIKCRKKESAAVANLPTQRRFWLDNLVIKSNRDNKDSDKKDNNNNNEDKSNERWRSGYNERQGSDSKNWIQEKTRIPLRQRMRYSNQRKDLFATKDEDQRSGSNERQGTESNKSKGSGLTKDKNTNPTKDLKYTNKDLIKRYALGVSSP